MRRLAIILLVLAVLAGCGSDAEIAGVGDAVIRQSDVRAMFLSDVPVDDAYRQALFELVAVEALRQDLTAEYGASVAQTAIDGYYDELEATITNNSAAPEDLLGVAGASWEMVRLNAEILALRDAALAQLVLDPDVVAGLFADPAIMTTVCLKHILVGTLEEAEAAKARLEAGEDFATVATEVSLDTASEGGDLGCTAAADYVTEFSQAALAATIGELTGPVETDYGFHLLIVSERTTHTRAEYDANPFALLSDQQLSTIWADWINRVLQASDAWVAESYGTWTATGILAPGSTPTTTTPTTTTTTPGTSTTTPVTSTTTPTTTTTTTPATTTTG